MTAASLERIDGLVEAGDDRSHGAAAPARQGVVLDDGDGSREVTAADLRPAAVALPALRKAIGDWRDGARGPTPP